MSQLGWSRNDRVPLKRLNITMGASKRKEAERPERKRSDPGGDGTKEAYDLETPLWRRYYERIRKGIRFPRYYDRSVNW